jgi:hypothetical protein
MSLELILVPLAIGIVAGLANRKPSGRTGAMFCLDSGRKDLTLLKQALLAAGYEVTVAEDSRFIRQGDINLEFSKSAGDTFAAVFQGKISETLGQEVLQKIFKEYTGLVQQAV